MQPAASPKSIHVGRDPTLEMRNLSDGLRQGGAVTGGPAPMPSKDRSRFLSKFDEVINAVRREYPLR
jgi:uncharacterized protein